MDNPESQIDEKTLELLAEFEVHRNEIKTMIVELEDIRSKVDTLIPTSLDPRYVRFFDEKVKSITNFFNSLLDMRKEIAKSIKDEIEIRRRIRIADKDFNIEDLLDVRKMARKIQDFSTKKKEIQSERIDEAKKQEIDESIVIPGLSDERGRAIKK